MYTFCRVVYLFFTVADVTLNARLKLLVYSRQVFLFESCCQSRICAIQKLCDQQLRQCVDNKVLVW